MGKICLLVGVGELVHLEAGDVADPFDRRSVVCGGVIVLLVCSRGVRNGIQAHLTQRHLQLVLSVCTENQQGVIGHGVHTPPKRPYCELSVSAQNYGTAFCT